MVAAPGAAGLSGEAKPPLGQRSRYAWLDPGSCACSPWLVPITCHRIDLLAAAIVRAGSVSTKGLENTLTSRYTAHGARFIEDPPSLDCGSRRTVLRPGHPGRVVAARHKRRFEAWLEEVLAADGFGDTAALARQLMILLDGAVAQILIHPVTAMVSMPILRMRYSKFVELKSLDEVLGMT